MRVSKPTREAHRAAILTEAGRLLRARGLDAVGVAEITHAAGLTHGAFYGHFPSKEALAAEAVRANLLNGAEAWRRRAEAARRAGGDPLAAIVRGYLTEAHRDAPQDGCCLPALGAELSRASPALADALREGSQALLAVLVEVTADPSRAAGILAAMTGGLVLARALAADSEASRRALENAARLALSV